MDLIECRWIDLMVVNYGTNEQASTCRCWPKIQRINSFDPISYEIHSIELDMAALAGTKSSSIRTAVNFIKSQFQSQFQSPKLTTNRESTHGSVKQIFGNLRIEEWLTSSGEQLYMNDLVKC